MKKLFLLFLSFFLLSSSLGTVRAEDGDAPRPFTSREVLFNEDLLGGTKLKDYTGDPITLKEQIDQLRTSGNNPALLSKLEKELEQVEGKIEDANAIRDDFQRTTPGEILFKSSVLKVTGFIRKIMIPLAILFSVWGGFHLIVSRNNQELLEEKQRHIYSMAIGFVIIFISTVVVDNVFFGEYGQALDSRELTSEFATRGISEAQGIFKYATTFVVAIAVGFIIFSAVKMMITAGEREEEVANLKKRLVYTTTGMILLVSAQNFVRIFMRDGRLSVPDIPDSIELIVRWGNFILGLIGVLAVFGLVYSGIRLISNMGIDDEGTEDAKNILKAAGIGLVLAFSAWTFMYYFLVPLG